MRSRWDQGSDLPARQPSNKGLRHVDKQVTSRRERAKADPARTLRRMGLLPPSSPGTGERRGSSRKRTPVIRLTPSRGAHAPAGQREGLVDKLTRASGGFLISGPGQVGIGRWTSLRNSRELQSGKSPLYFTRVFRLRKNKRQRGGRRKETAAAGGERFRERQQSPRLEEVIGATSKDFTGEIRSGRERDQRDARKRRPYRGEGELRPQGANDVLRQVRLVRVPHEADGHDLRRVHEDASDPDPLPAFALTKKREGF